MVLLNEKIKEITLSDRVDKIRSLFAEVIEHADSNLTAVRILVRKYGRQTIAAELGNDAAAMLTVYTKLKEAIEAAKDIEVEDLP